MYPPKKYTDRNLQCLRDYLEFLETWDDHKDFVFADEKPMVEADTYGRVRRDIITGEVPPNVSDEGSNAKRRYNIFAAVTTKRNVERNVEAVVLDMIGDSTLFQTFVLHLLQLNFLEPGDIFVVDNCSIHMQGTNQFLVETLWTECGILMVPLPPYTPELNPTELAFNAMTARIKASRSRSILAPGHFAAAVKEEFNRMSRRDVKKFYTHCGYNV
jgi:transposase